MIIIRYFRMSKSDIVIEISAYLLFKCHIGQMAYVPEISKNIG